MVTGSQTEGQIKGIEFQEELKKRKKKEPELGLEPEGYVFDYDTGQFVSATAGQVAQREQLYADFPEIGPLGTPGKITPAQFMVNQQKQKDELSLLIQRIYPEKFPESITPDITSSIYREVVNQAQGNTEDFISDLLKRASSQDTEALLRSLGAAPEDIDQILGVQQQETRLTQNIQAVFPGMNTDDFINFVENDFDRFSRDILVGGLTPEKQDLLQLIGYTPEQISEAFTPAPVEAPAVEAPVAIWEHYRTGETITQAEKNRRYPKGWEAGLDEWRLTNEAARQYPVVFKVFGEALTKIPKQTGAAILQAVLGTGGASVVNKGWANELIKDASEDIDKFVQETSGIKTDLPFDLTELARLPQSMAFSLTSMGAGLATGVPIGLIPVPFARVAAWSAGTAASGAVAFRMASNQIMQQYLEAMDADKKAETGEGLTIAEENALKAEFETKAKLYGLWEALPEAVSNLAFAKILTGPLGLMVGKSIASRVISKIAALYGEEFLTETVTQKMQSAIEVEAGLREGNISWWEAFKEIAPQTFLLTTIMGGSGQVAVDSYNKIRNSLMKETGDSNLRTTILQKLQTIINDETGSIQLPGRKPVDARIAELEAEKQKLIGEGKNFEASKISDQIQALKETPAIPQAEVTPAPEVTKLTDVEVIAPKIIGYGDKVQGVLREYAADYTGIMMGQGTKYKNISAVKRALQDAGLPEKAASDAQWLVEKSINDYYAKLREIRKAKATPTTPAAIPQAEAGMPEAGLQTEMFGAPPAEVRPRGKGEVVQISMEDQLKLEEARRAAEKPTALEQLGQAGLELDQVQAQLETLTELKGTSKLKGLLPLWRRIQKRKDQPADLTLKEYRDFTGRETPPATSLTPDRKHVYWRDALDSVASEYGFADTEQLLEALNQLGESELRIKELRNQEAQLAEEVKELQAKIPPLPALPEPTAVESIESQELVGNPNLTPQQVDRVLDYFGKYIEGPNALSAWELTRELRRETKAGQAEALKNRAQELIVSEKINPEDAMLQAIREALSGKQPAITTDYLDDVTDQIREAMFYKVYQTLKNEPFEMASTVTALTNALTGKPIPREPGVKGGSALTRLQRVFGTTPVMKALDTIASTKKPLRNVVEGVFREYVEGGSPPIPVDQETAEYLRHLSDIPFGRAILGGKLPSLPPLPPDTRTPAQKATDLQAFKLELTPDQYKGWTPERLEQLSFLRVNLLKAEYQAKLIEGEWISPKPLPPDTRTPAQKETDLQAFKLELTPDQYKDWSPERLEQLSFLRINLLKTEYQAKLIEGEWIPPKPLPADARTPAQIALDLQEFATELAPPPTGITGPRYEAPIEDAAKLLELIPARQKGIMIRALKEAGLTAIDIGNFLRANKASFDFSWWRQQAPLIVNHRSEFIQANIEAWKAMWNQKSAEASWEFITRRPLYQYYEESGYDFLRPLELPKGTEQWKGVEEYGYLGSERPIPKFTEKLPWVKLSQRAFVTGTNAHNWRIFENHYKAMLRLSEKIASGQVKLKEGEAFDIQSEMTDMARLLSDFTGRAKLGKASGLAPVLSAFFFAPRYKLGRILTPRHLFSSNPRIRAEAWKDLSTFVGTTGGIIALGALLGLWDVEWDKRSPDFMKIRVGNLRVDPWGGYQQLAVFASRLFEKTGVSSITGQEYKADFYDILTNFIKGAQAPLASLILDTYTGKTFIGEELDIKDPKQWADRIAPMIAVDMYEAFKDSGISPAVSLPLASLGFLGAGVQAYTGDWRENFQKLGTPKYQENLEYGLTEPPYNTQDLWADHSASFKGVDPATLTEQKGFPEYIRSMAESRAILERLSVLPNSKLIDINIDATKGTTLAQYRQMWLDRERIVASGDEAKLKEFDQDDRTKNAYIGSIRQRDYALLAQYHSLPETKQKEFLEQHPDLDLNPRTEYLKSHPKENAELALWGVNDTKILTMEAYNQFKALAKSLDIPENALPDLTLPPEKSVQNYFDRLDAIEKYEANSAESMLILAKDEDLQKWLKLDKPEFPVRYYELKVKNRAEREYWATITDKDSAEYIADNPDTKLNEQREDFAKKFPQTSAEYWDDERRTQTIAKKFTDTEIEDWVERGRLVDKFSGNSPKVKEWAFDNPEAYAKAIEQKMIEDKGGLPDAEARGHYEKWVEPAIRLQAKNIQEDAYWQELGDKNLPDVYIEDEKKRREKFLKKFPGSAYFDDMERIEAYKGGFNETEANLWANRGQTIAKFSPSSAEAKVWLLDHPDVWKKALDAKLLTDDGKDWNEPAIRITAKWRVQDDAYDAIDPDVKNPKTGLYLRDEMLAENPEYRIARRQRKFYEIDQPDKSDALRDKYVGLYELPGKGFRQERFLIDPANEDLYDILTNPAIMGDKVRSPIEPEDVPDVRYDEITEASQDLFDKWEGYSKGTSDLYIADDEARDAARAELTMTKGNVVYSGVNFYGVKKLTNFGKAVYEREAYYNNVPKERVADYVAWKTIGAEGKPENWELKTETDLWYEDNWFLMEHPGFYKNVYIADLDKDGKPDHERADFRTVPPREVFNKYLTYLTLPRGTRRNNFRFDNLDLDDWLVLKFEYKSITEQKRRGELTPTERALEDVATQSQEWQRQLDEIEKILAGVG